jgi:hypothetical protein
LPKRIALVTKLKAILEISDVLMGRVFRFRHKKSLVRYGSDYTGKELLGHERSHRKELPRMSAPVKRFIILAFGGLKPPLYLVTSVFFFLTNVAIISIIPYKEDCY